jgi:hypothetical protein
MESALGSAAELMNSIAENKGAPEPAAKESIVDQIKQLAELRDTGILTEDEFAAKKAELLAKM